MSVLWYTIPLAVALALSVVPIAVVLLLLLAPDPLPRSIPFAIGSVLGVAVLVTGFAFGASLLPHQSGDDLPPWIHVAEIGIGVCLIATAGILAMRRTDAAPPADRPTLAAAADNLTPVRSFGFGVLLNVRPKSILLTVAAGLAIGTAPLEPVLSGVTVAVFAIIAGSAVTGLVIAYAVGQNRVRPGLGRLRDYLMTHAGLVLRIALLGIGVVLVGVGAVQLLTR